MGEGRTGARNADRTGDGAATEPTGRPTERLPTVGEAAGILGITAEAVRSRVKRGTLGSTKRDGTVYVLLEGDVSNWRKHGDRTATERDVPNAKKAGGWTGPGTKSDRTATEHDGTNARTTEHDRTQAPTSPEPDQTTDRAELVDVLRDQVEYLREQLGEEREARRRADMLLARLAEANANMAGEIRELTAPDRAPDEPETVAEPSESTEPRPDTVGPQTGAEEPEETARRPWWLRWLGG